MDLSFQRAAVKRCASELMRATWYYRCWKQLQGVERIESANFIFLAETAMHDQMIAHAIKVLSMNSNGRGAICSHHSIDLEPVRVVGKGLRLIRDKTHMHLDEVGVMIPAEIWNTADITHDQFDGALSLSLVVIKDLYRIIRNENYESWEYDGADARVIAEHANEHDLLLNGRPRAQIPFWDDPFGSNPTTEAAPP
jgi:hypothetical protein